MGGGHQNRRARELFVTLHGPEKMQAAHWLQIPVGHDETVFSFLEHAEGVLGVVRSLDVVEPEPEKKVSDQTGRRAFLVHQQGRIDPSGEKEIAWEQAGFWPGVPGRSS